MQPTLSTLTLLKGTLTLIFWRVHLGLFSSEKFISSENVSWNMRSESLIRLHSTSESQISRKSSFSNEIASRSFLCPNLTRLKSLFKGVFLVVMRVVERVVLIVELVVLLGGAGCDTGGAAAGGLHFVFEI